MMIRYVCELCQMYYSSEVTYYEHLKTYTTKELEVLRKIAEIKLNMTDEEERRWNLDFVSLLYYLEQDNVGFDIGNFDELLRRTKT